MSFMASKDIIDRITLAHIVNWVEGENDNFSLVEIRIEHGTVVSEKISTINHLDRGQFIHLGVFIMEESNFVRVNKVSSFFLLVLYWSFYGSD